MSFCNCKNCVISSCIHHFLLNIPKEFFHFACYSVCSHPEDDYICINFYLQELLEKCQECVNIIRAAKDQQAAKANKNASILLEELDMEKTREESKKAAAARRRERKKKKKLEKKEEKRKLHEENKKNEILYQENEQTNKKPSEREVERQDETDRSKTGTL